MTSHALANQHAELAVPVAQDFVERGALAATGRGDDERPEAAVHAFAHAMDQGVTLLGSDAEGVGEIRAVETLANRQLENESITIVESGRGRSHERGQFGESNGGAVGARISGRHHVGDRARLEVGGCGAPTPLGASVHLVAQNRVQPRFQTIGVAELTQSFGGDAEDVLHHVGGVVAVREHGRGRVVETTRVAVVDGGESTTIARQMGGDECGVGECRAHDRSGVACRTRERPAGHLA